MGHAKAVEDLSGLRDELEELKSKFRRLEKQCAGTNLGYQVGQAAKGLFEVCWGLDSTLEAARRTRQASIVIRRDAGYGEYEEKVTVFGLDTYEQNGSFGHLEAIDSSREEIVLSDSEREAALEALSAVRYAEKARAVA